MRETRLLVDNLESEFLRACNAKRDAINECLLHRRDFVAFKGGICRLLQNVVKTSCRVRAARSILARRGYFREERFCKFRQMVVRRLVCFAVERMVPAVVLCQRRAFAAA